MLAQVQRTRSLFDRALLDETRAHFLRARAAVMDAIDALRPTRVGRSLPALRHAFYEAIEPDAVFYGPIVTDGGHEAFLDADKATPACGAASSVLPTGTPVSAPLETRGEMMRVRLLDAQWEWLGDDRCDAVHTQPVWVPSAAIGTDYPR